MKLIIVLGIIIICLGIYKIVDVWSNIKARRIVVELLNEIDSKIEELESDSNE